MEAFAAPDADRRTCPNCHSLLLGPYCAQCGQPGNGHRRSLRKLLHELFADIVSFDSRILRTGWALLLRPGELTRAFQEGRMQRYVPAVRLYLFVSLFFFVILSACHIAVVQFVVTSAPISPAPTTERNATFETETHAVFFSPIGSVKSELSSAVRRQFDAEMKKGSITIETGDKKVIRENLGEKIGRILNDPAALNGPLSEWIPRALFLLLPVFALLLAWLYRRPRGAYFFVDHLVFALNYHSFGFVLMLIVAGLKQTFLAERALWLLPLGLGVSFLVALRRCYRQNWFWTVLKGATAAVFYSFFLLTAGLVVLVLGVIYD